MTLKLFLHVFALGLWGGCVGAEMVMEFLGTRHAALRPALARFHHAIDCFVEIPVLFAILVTGWSLYSPERASTLLYVKIGAGLAAITANFLCVIPVTRRKRAADAGDTSAMDRHAKGVWLAFAVGLPCALVALSLGLYLDSFS